jgi:hypothetical protein
MGFLTIWASALAFLTSRLAILQLQLLHRGSHVALAGQDVSEE